MSEARHPSAGGQGARRPGAEPLDGDVSYRAILRFTIGLTVLIVAAAGLMWILTVGLRDRVAAQDPPPPVLPEARMRYEPPAPRLQASPEMELRQMQAEDAAALGEYAWVDEAAGVARVPIERAMQLLVARGTAALGGGVAATGRDAETSTEAAPGTGEATTPKPMESAPEDGNGTPAEGES